MRKYVTEGIGAFFLVFTIGMAVVPAKDAGALAPLAIGSVLMVMVYAGGHISGAHYNPAVTLAVFLRGRCPITDVPFYMLAQFAGGLLAAAIVMFVKGSGAPTAGEHDAIKAAVVEFLFTFALVYVVLNVATSKAHPANSFYGLAIGFTVLAGAFAVGPVSGGAFNPAVAVALKVLNLTTVQTLVVQLVATFAGAAGAAFVFKFLNPDDR